MSDHVSLPKYSLTHFYSASVCQHLTFTVHVTFHFTVFAFEYIRNSDSSHWLILQLHFQR